MLLIVIVRWESMGFARQASAAVFLVTVTLLLQCAGMAILIHWARARIAHGIKGLGPVRSAVLIVRFTTLMIVLHILQILLWAGFYRWHCLPSWEACFYFSSASYSTVGYGDIALPRVWRLLGAGGEHYWCPDVWPFRELPVRDRDSPGRRQVKFSREASRKRV